MKDFLINVGTDVWSSLMNGGYVYVFLTAACSVGLRIWLPRIARQEDQKLQAEIIKLKDSLDAEQKKLAGFIDRVNHVHKAQFEKEFQIYQDLMKKVHEVRGTFFALYNSLTFIYPDPRQQVEKENKLQTDFGNAFYDFRDVVDINKPFYSNGIEAACQPLLSLCTEALTEIIAGCHKKNPDEMTKLKTELLEATDIIASAIRERLSSITIVD